MSQLHLLSPRGFCAAGVSAKIKSKGGNDVGLLVCADGATAAAMFTSNKVFAAPIAVGREHVRNGILRAIVVNSGNANACTGKRGLRDARKMCAVTAGLLGFAPSYVLPSSTGVIGHHLPMDKVLDGIYQCSTQLGSSSEHAAAFTDAILTTDTRRKVAATTVKRGKSTCTIAGICKGAGMIGPRLVSTAAGSLKGRHATMLAYLTTDAQVSAPALRKLMQPAVHRSFNAVTIDDHTSTNDTAVVLASGQSDFRVDSFPAAKAFLAALTEVCQSLAYQIAADGEGATKVVRIDVRAAASERDATLMARAIANSPLVKCAMHGADPNWGRIVSAAGMCGARFNPDRATLTLQGSIVFKKGKPAHFHPGVLSQRMAALDEITVDLNCGIGKSAATVWTCDLSKEYVTINADYHT